MKNKLIIGTRSSDLALWQAEFVKGELEKHNPGLEVELKLVKTKGDKILDVALSKIGDKGLFTKELEIALINDEIDIAVHSLKDLQTEIPEGLKLACITSRHPVEDVLIAREKGVSVFDLPEGCTVATGSLRRRCQLKHLRPDINIVELRGNVPTRIRKFEESDWAAIILARAGVERLKLEDKISSVISVEEFVPAVGQGALGIEIKDGNEAAEDALKPLNDMDTWYSVTAERALLKRLEGGCQIPIGARAEVKANGLYLDAIVGSIDGTVTYRKKIRYSKRKAEEAGIKLAEDLLEAGAGEVLDQIRNDGNIKGE